MISMISVSRLPRSASLALAVSLVHGLALWAFQGGLLRRSPELLVPVHMLSELLEAPRPALPPSGRQAAPARKAEPAPAAPTPPATPTPLAVPHSQPAPNGPTAAAPAAAPAPAPAPDPVSTTTGPVAAVPVPAAPVEPRMVPPPVELPNSDADYLQNPRPVYPATSRRLNEQGTVLVRVLIGADGAAQKAEVQESSGFFRLDDAAVATVVKWRYVPGKRAGKPEPMWFTVPIAWVLR